MEYDAARRIYEEGSAGYGTSSINFNILPGNPSFPTMRMESESEREGDRNTVCNACVLYFIVLFCNLIICMCIIAAGSCGLYYKLHVSPCPIPVKSDIIRKRSRYEARRGSGITDTSSVSPSVSPPDSPILGGAMVTSVGVNSDMLRQLNSSGSSENPALGGVKAECVNCGTTHTALWRRGLNDELNCYVCGLYYKLASSFQRSLVSYH
jgi:GATA zinc finger